jgi:hypothetical protein
VPSKTRVLTAILFTLLISAGPSSAGLKTASGTALTKDGFRVATFTMW